MKELAFMQKEQDTVKLLRIQDKQEIDPQTPLEGILMSRTDFTIKTTTIPPIQSSEVRNMLSYRLRSMYPGDPEQTIFDYKIIIRGKNRYAILFITTRDTIEEYRTFCPRGILWLPFNLIRPLLKMYTEKLKIFLFWHPDWIDISIFEDDVLVNSTAVKREVDPGFDLHKIQNVLPKDLENYQIISLSFMDEMDSLKNLAKEQFKKTISPQFISIEESVSYMNNKMDFLFKQQIVNPVLTFYNKLRVDYLLIPLILFALLLFNKQVMFKRDYRNKLKQVYTETIERSQLQGVYNKKLEELKELEKKKPPDMYRLFSELSKIFRYDIKIETFRYNKDGTFIVDCIGIDPLNRVKEFNENDFFDSVKVREIETIPGSSRVKFRLTGRLNEER
ncbi:MAG: hypothetical protein JW969_01985 [Spirochaetales bacterium]|nr:hypothetical protein [Spirochaetales bacterium]